MAKKIEIISPYLLILFLCFLLIGFNFWTSTVKAGDTSTTQVIVGNATPVVSSVSFNEGDSVVLTENSTKTVTVRALITDSNGCEDIWNGGAEAMIYRSGATASCSADLDDCYLLASCSTDSARNNCTGGADTDLIMSCSVNLQYFVDPTDGTASSSGEQWYGAIRAWDLAGGDHIASNSTQTTDVQLLRALEASASVDFTTVAAGANTGASPIEMGVRNTGNSGMDPLISTSTGTGTLTCSTAGTCGSSTIADANQKYASVSQDYSVDYNTALSGTNTQFNAETSKPLHSTYPVDDQIFWGLGVDAGQQPGTYTGTTYFTAAGD